MTIFDANETLTIYTGCFIRIITDKGNFMVTRQLLFSQMNHSLNTDSNWESPFVLAAKINGKQQEMTVFAIDVGDLIQI